MNDETTKIVVVGGTIAGMIATIAAAEKGAHVTLGSCVPLARSSDTTFKDGIAAVVYPEAYGDSTAQHVRDTLAAEGAGVDEVCVQRMCERAPGFIRFLTRAGALFNRTSEGDLEQHSAPGHTQPRIARVDDATGSHVVRILEEQIRRFEARGRVERKEYVVPLSLVFDEEDRCRGVVIMQRTNHACMALKADAVILATRRYAGLYGNAPYTPHGLVIDDAQMTTQKGLFAAGSCAQGYYGEHALDGNVMAAHLVGGAYAGESACLYVAGLTTHADDLGSSLFERASDREEKFNKEIMNRTEGENPYIVAADLSDVVEKGACDEGELNALEERAGKTAIPDQLSWWNDGLIVTRDLQNKIVLARMVAQNDLK